MPMFKDMNLKLSLFLVFILGCEIKKPEEVIEVEQPPCTQAPADIPPTSVNLQIHISIPLMAFQEINEEAIEVERNVERADQLLHETNEALDVVISEQEENDTICIGCDDSPTPTEPGVVEVTVDPLTGEIEYIIKGIEIDLE